MKYQRLTIIALGTLLAARATAGQEARPSGSAGASTPSTRVRLTMADGSRLKADLVRVEEGRFIVRTTERISEERSIASTEVTRAEVSRGGHTRIRRGALVGLGVGVASTAVLGLICQDDWGQEGGESCTGTTALGGLILIPGGAIAGAGIGGKRRERWAEVPVSSLGAASPPVKSDPDLPAVSPDRQVGFSIAPTNDRGLQARFSISWR
jgi:hypothetical protein